MPSDQSPEQMLAEAATVFATDPDRSLALRRAVAESSVDRPWSEANIDLASYESGQGNYERALLHSSVVVAAPVDLVDPAARAVAGILLSDAQAPLDLAIDELLLTESIEACVATGHPYYAAAGLVHLSRRRLSSGDRIAARAALIRSVPLFDQAGMMMAGPRALHQLAQIELDDQRVAEARSHLDQGLAWLARFPLGGSSVQLLEAKVRSLRATIG